ncbi:DUF3455 domain-containing protein [Ideonella sp. BN130291]|uniref:DUF3455 domain-containing protein n=1 Tax=Ideonella sp. BN130291 TaxID=3112940 RepID=UPI002E267B25|nr:DUF3455 domain-containing protein [Ideonella sp. BN130291]
MTARILVFTLPALLLAACAGGPPARPAADDTPAALKPASGEHALMTLAAKGVQIYECRARKDAPGATEWVFVAPEAELFDGAGKKVGTHYAGPSWESVDGSKLVGKVAARVDAPEPGAIPWLLLTTQSTGPHGTFSKVSAIQRLNTEGGVAPPAAGCTSASVGKTERVGYLADYRLLVR